MAYKPALETTRASAPMASEAPTDRQAGHQPPWPMSPYRQPVYLSPALLLFLERLPLSVSVISLPNFPAFMLLKDKNGY